MIKIRKSQILTLFLLLSSQMMVAQASNPCQAVVELTIKCINEHTTEPLQAHLSPDFTMAAQTGQIAQMVLKQLFTQLDDEVVSYTKKSEQVKEQETVLVYTINYQKRGERAATFIFDRDHRLKELILFEMTVKTMSEKTEIVKNEAPVVEVPFELAGKLIAVTVFLNGKERKFILDSGAPKVILNAKYLPAKADSVQALSSSKGVSGPIGGMNIDTVEQLSFAGIQLQQQQVITLDLSHLEAALDYEFHGLIGFELIKDYDLVFDYKNRILTLIDPNYFDTYQQENLAAHQMTITPFELSGHIPVIQAKVGHQDLKLGIDSGAESNLLDESFFHSLKTHLYNIEFETLNGADNLPKEVKKGSVKEMKIGTQVFQNLPTSFSDISHLNEGYHLNIDGLIGYPLLSKQKTLISFFREELIFIAHSKIDDE